MEHYRPTKAIIDLGSIRRNTQRILAQYPGYQYYMAVVKADCYGYRGRAVVQAMLDGGANCLAASLLEEGLQLRQWFPQIPILLFTPLSGSDLSRCKDADLMVTVANQAQAGEAAPIAGLKVCIRANGGSDIFGGPRCREDFEALWHTLERGACRLHGIYLHSYNAEEKDATMAEYAAFEAMTAGVDLSQLELVSLSNSLTLPRYGKKPYCNGCRLGNILYRIESQDSALEHTFRLVSRIHSVFDLPQGSSVAYSHAYTASSPGERIAAVPIGFGDGFAKTNIGRDVFIRGRRYPIAAVTMDITLVRVDDTIDTGDEVELIRDNRHLDEISAHIHCATEEPICALNKRVWREYRDE